MAIQGIWSGTISFSLVAIPVQLVKAIEPGRVSFRLLHSTDYSPLARKLFCPAQEQLVSPDEVIRGYEIAPDRYLPITDEELASVSPERSRTIEIVEFIDLTEVDPIYFDHPYYLLPLKGGEKAYRLLAEVMQRTNRAGLAKFVLAEREYLVALISKGGALALFTLHYGEEIVAEPEIEQKRGGSRAEATQRMKKTIHSMMAQFNPSAYADERRQKVMDLLQKKLQEKATVEAPAMESDEGEAPADLLAALEEIMQQMKQQR